MSVRHALLAILDQGSCYGNQLKAEYDRRTAMTWPLNVGQIYTTLDRLERDGLVDSVAPDTQGHRMYSLTAAGRTEVAEWFARPLAATSTRDELATKISLAVTLAGVDAIEVIRLQRICVHERLAQLRLGDAAADGTRPTGGADTAITLAIELIRDAQIGSVEAEALWLDLAERRILDAGPARGEIALDAHPPRRGRPRQS